MLCRVSIALVLLTLTLAPAFADNWPQWRGIKNDGHSAEKGLPTEWSTEKNVLWKLPMPGHGSSTPCVWDDNIFVTSMNGDQVVLLCVGTDGKVKWNKLLGANAKGGYRGEGDDASASCSTDGKHVWAFAGTGKLACFDFDGNQVWETDVRKFGKQKTFKIQFGIHWTPVLYKGRLYLQVMHRNAQCIVALDAATGKEIWNVDRPGYGRGESPDTYASAFMWEGEGGPLFVAHGNDFCTGHKLEDGSEVWRVAGLNPVGGRQHEAWRFVASPLVTDKLIVVPSCKDGPVVGFNPVGARGSIDPKNPAELWRLKFTPDVVSPLLVDDIVYLMKDGPLYAIDAKTGEQIYQKPLQAKQRVYRGNMVYADGKIYIVGVDGVGVVVQAGRQFKQLAANELKEKTYASPAVANGRIYIRTWDHLYCIGTK